MDKAEKKPPTYVTKKRDSFPIVRLEGDVLNPDPITVPDKVQETVEKFAEEPCMRGTCLFSHDFHDRHLIHSLCFYAIHLLFHS
jgi:hypothetical protein